MNTSSSITIQTPTLTTTTITNTNSTMTTAPNITSSQSIYSNTSTTNATTTTTSTTPLIISEEKVYKKEKQILFEFDLKTKDLRGQLNESLKCLEQRLDTQISIIFELQDFFKKRAEVELQYSKDLDKLVKQVSARHKSEKSKRETWHLYSTTKLWESLLNDTKQHSKYHQILSDVCSKYIGDKYDEIIEDVKRIFTKCKGVGQSSHNEIFKTIGELHGAMKTYHEYQSESKQAEAKLKYVQSQKPKYEKTKSQKKLKQFEKQVEKRQQKYTETKIKAFKARNEYILSIDSVNACISKYCKEDIADLIDCMDFGFHASIAKCIYMYISGQENIKRSRQITVDSLSRSISDLDSNADKQNYLDSFANTFNIQKKFQFEPHKGDEVSQVNAQSLIRYDMEKRYEQLEYRLSTLKTENDEIFKTIEATEQSLLNFFDLKNCDMSDLFRDLNIPNINQAKDKRLEIEDYYIEKFRQYTTSSNLIARLEARHGMMKKALSSAADRSRQQEEQLLIKEQKPKKKIGKSPLIGQPRLFGGKLCEYLNATKQEIPLIITSSIKAINRLGLHNQGIFRIPGSLAEINQFKEAFEKGEDPLITVNPREMNSVAGVLKLYFRELKDPLFPRDTFDAFTNSMRTTPECETLEQQELQKIDNLKKVVLTLPTQIFIVMRYLFAFLNHLSEFKDENMMDSYNIAICLAPTLIPIPEDKKDQVNYQTDTIELIKLIIQNYDEIFPILETHNGPIYEKFDIEESDNYEDNIESEEEEESEKQFLRSLSDDESDTTEAIALYDYKGRTEKEITFKKGEKLIIKGQLSADWWLGGIETHSPNGSNLTVKYGYIPDKYIALRNKNRKGSNVSCDFELNKTNLSDLSKIKESDILNDNEENHHQQQQQQKEQKQLLTNNEDYLKFQKQKIEFALASVLNDMKQLDTNTLSSLKSSRRNSSFSMSNNEKNENGSYTSKATNGNHVKVVNQDEDEDDYVEPPDDDDADNDSNDIILSSSTSTSTSTIPIANVVNNKQPPPPPVAGSYQATTEEKISDILIKAICNRTNGGSPSANQTTSSTTSPLHNTFNGNKETLNKSIEEIKNMMQSDLTTPNKQQQQQQIGKSIQKIQESIGTPTSTTYNNSPNLSSNRLLNSNNGINRINDTNHSVKSPVITDNMTQSITSTTTPSLLTHNNRIPNLNVICGNTSNIMMTSPIISNTLPKNSSISNNQNSSKIMSTTSTSTPIRNSTNSINNTTKTTEQQNSEALIDTTDSKTTTTTETSDEQEQKVVQTDTLAKKQKPTPPPIMKKPENAEEILRKLGSNCIKTSTSTTSPESNLKIRLSKSRATDV